MRTLLALVAASALAGAAASAQPDMSRAVKRFDLPAGLIEISGLAVAPSGGLFAHNDEHAIVYEISAETGEILRAFAMGDPTAQSDFEGIAVSANRVYLIDSNGRLFESEIGSHRERMKYNVYDTGVGEYCEIEGLAVGPADGEFLIACKLPRDSRYQDKLVVFRWNVATRLPLTAPWIEIDLENFLTAAERRDFRPSAIEWRAGAGELVVLSARNRIMAAITPTGALRWKTKLGSNSHLQSEGLAISDRLGLVIADEGARRGPGKITIYEFKR